jgi:transposase-like protein
MNMIEPTAMAKPRRRYNVAFKRQAVEHWLASGKSAQAIGRELGITAERLYVWRSRLAPGSGKAPLDLQAELEATRQELARVSEQRDILKKTLGIISEPSPKGTSGSTR